MRGGERKTHLCCVVGLRTPDMGVTRRTTPIISPLCLCELTFLAMSTNKRKGRKNSRDDKSSQRRLDDAFAKLGTVVPEKENSRELQPLRYGPKGDCCACVGGKQITKKQKNNNK